jgi:RNA polymerase sigma-70 factor, ECF subfamily
VVSIISDKQEDFERETGPHKKLLFNSLLKILNDYQDAEDVFQDTMFNAFKSWDDYESGTNIAGWLFRIAANLLKDKKKKEKTSEKPTFEYKDHLRNDHIPSFDPANIIDDNISVEVKNALGSLDKKRRLFMDLFYFQEYRVREIADVLKIEIGTVKSAMSISRVALRKIPRLQKYYLDARQD